MHQILRPIISSSCAAVVSSLVMTGLAQTSSPPCRTFTTDEVRMVSGAAAGTITQTCQFDLPSTSRICTMRTRLRHTSFDLMYTDKYNSVADFVDEVRSVPPIARIQTQSRRYTSGSGPNAQITYEYDATRRQTRLSTNMGGNLLVTTYSAWDPIGRPTAVKVSSAASTFNLQYKYDDALRVMTITGPAGVQVQTYDADGNMIREETTDGGGKALYAIKINKTEKVCK
jgi:YD repeat-containing protein